MEHVEHRFADNDGVKIHYAVAGSGPLVVFIHGWPDFWYSWKNQMEGLSDEYTVVALDTRGYNKSDKPEGGENYAMPHLVADVAAVVKQEKRDKAIIVGHDWGGMIAWSFAMAHPELTDKLVILNLPHPKGLTRELAKMEQQHKNSSYARRFQQPDSHKGLNAEGLASIVSRGDAELKGYYKTAFENSSFDAMMNYYRQNYPREPYAENAQEYPMLEMPVLQFHGLNDTALLAGALDRTWEYLKKDYTLVTIPGVGHWSHHEAPDMVTDTMRWWLKMRK
ncbi:MAG TPA: alpha/beta hydrolase [Candidatus Hydrogenedentes bacterium]|nr:alpha/beta hydrolase [Candidatus Hydrogenedentota bacterium]